MDTQEHSPDVFSNLPMEQVPTRVASCIDNLATIKRKVDIAIQNAKAAQKASKEAKKINPGIWKFGSKSAIEALQEAQGAMSVAQGDQAEATKLLYEYQAKVALCMRTLFCLGVQNMAKTRTVVREIKMRLEKASEAEIGQLARKELFAVMAQLQEQLDIRENQERLANAQKSIKATVQTHEESLGRLCDRESEQDRLLMERLKAEKAQNAEIQRQAEKDAEHDRRLDEDRKDIDTLQKGVFAQGKAIEKHARIDQEQNEELQRQAEKDKEHDERIDENCKDIDTLQKGIAAQGEAIEERFRIDQEQNEELQRQAEKDKEHDERIDENSRNIKKQARLIALIEDQLAKHRHELAGITVIRGNSRLSMWLAIVALIFSIISTGLAVYSMTR